MADIDGEQIPDEHTEKTDPTPPKPEIRIRADKSRAPQVEIELAFPIEVGGVKVKKLTLKRPKVADRLLVDEAVGLSDGAREIRLIGNLCGLAPDEMEQVDLSDYGRLSQQLLNFTSAQPKS